MARGRNRTTAAARSSQRAKSRANGTIRKRVARSGFGVTKVKKSK